MYQKQISIIGVSHKTLAIEDREKIQRLALNQSEFLDQIRRANPRIEEAIILSTCNRFEIICTGEQAEVQAVQTILSAVPFALSESNIYSRINGDAVRHLYSVASSLDSMVVGETQILNQLKSAYELAIRASSVSKYLHHLLQSAFVIAKKVRRHTAISEGGLSIGYIAVQLAQSIFGALGDVRALIIGSGTTAELVAIHLQQSGCSNITVANRTVERAVELAAKVKGRAVPLAEAQSMLDRVDVVIGSISIDRPLFKIEDVEKLGKGRALFFIDLGVPRNFSTSLAEIDGVYLYNIDDLAQIASKNKNRRQKACQDAEVIIDYGVFRFDRWMTKVAGESALIDSRASIHQVCQEEVASTLGTLLPEADQHRFARKLANKLSQRLVHGEAIDPEA